MSAVAPVEPEVVGNCIRCTRRLVRVGRGQVHEHNGQVRCESSVIETCSMCRGPSVIQCARYGCDVLAHPGCLINCDCCSRLFCKDHSAPGSLCDACAASAQVADYIVEDAL